MHWRWCMSSTVSRSTIYAAVPRRGIRCSRRRLTCENTAAAVAENGCSNAVAARRPHVGHRWCRPTMTSARAYTHDWVHCTRVLEHQSWEIIIVYIITYGLGSVYLLYSYLYTHDNIVNRNIALASTASKDNCTLHATLRCSECNIKNIFSFKKKIDL